MRAEIPDRQQDLVQNQNKHKTATIREHTGNRILTFLLKCFILSCCVPLFKGVLLAH